MKKSLYQFILLIGILAFSPISLHAEKAEEKKAENLVIIGGGSIGLFSAKYAHDKGMKVTLLEKSTVASGSSAGNTGLLVPSHTVPAADPQKLKDRIWGLKAKKSTIKMNVKWEWPFVRWVLGHLWASQQSTFEKSSALLKEMGAKSSSLYRDLVCEYKINALNCRGRYLVYSNAEHLEKDAEKFQAEILSPSQLAVLHPMVNEAEVAGGIFFKDDAHVDPYGFLTELSARLKNDGVQIKEQTSATSFIIENKKIKAVITNEGETIPCDALLIAGGFESNDVLRMLGEKEVLLQPVAGYSVTYSGLSKQHYAPIMFMDEHTTFTCFGDSVRIASVGILGDSSPEHDENLVETMLSMAQPLLNVDLSQVPQENTKVWKGIRPCTPDDMPYMGQVGSLDNCFISAGHSSLGIHLGPVSGLLMAELICGEEPQISLEQLSPKRS